MGIKSQFFKSVVGRNKSSKKIQLKELSEHRNIERLGIDLSIRLHASLKGDGGVNARAIACDPPYPPMGVVQSVLFQAECIKRSGIEPVYYFEGGRNPLKSLTDYDRKRKRERAKRSCKRLCKKAVDHEGNPTLPAITKADRTELAKQQLAAAAPDEDIYAMVLEALQQAGIKVVCGPSEAEQQLVEDERAGVIDGIFSEDGDCIGLGAKLMVTRVELVNDELVAVVVEGEEWIRNKSAQDGFSYTIDDVPEIAAFSGCDYIPHLVGFGPVTARENWEKWDRRSEDRKEKLLRKIEAEETLSKEWADLLREFENEDESDESSEFENENESDEGSPIRCDGSKCVGWAKRFHVVRNFFRHAPVFRRIPKEGVEYDPFDPDTFTVALAPLRPFEGSNEEWGAAIGWGGAPARVLGLRTDHYKDYLSLKCWARTNAPMRRTRLQYFSAEENPDVAGTELLPAFARINFATQPASIQPSETLKLHLNCRGLFLGQHDGRRELEELVREAHRVGAQVFPPVSTGLVGDAWIGFEALGVGSDGAEWSSNFCDAMRKLRKVDDSEVDELFGTGTNGVRRRGLDLCRGGFFDLELLKQCSVMSGSNESRALRLFRCPCLSSHKKNQWTVHLCFTEAGGRMMMNPHSSCECPVGSFFCSHMLGLLLVISIVQDDRSVDEALFVRKMPSSVKNMEELPLLVEAVAVKEHLRRTKPRGKEKDRRQF